MNRHVVVIGAGASGAVTATRLLEDLSSGDLVTLVGRDEDPGKGVAYGTQDLDHRLNVRAQNMSAYSDEPGHFLEWLVDRGAGTRESIAECFVARPIFGEYLTSTLQAAISSSSAGFQFQRNEAISLDSKGDHIEVTMADGITLLATHVVLATGHLGPKVPAQFSNVQEHARFIKTPWGTALARADFKDQDVLIVGTGLTMVDTVMAVKRTIGTGRIYARSRRGLMPHPHRRGPKPAPIMLDDQPETARGLARQIICRSRSAGPNWRNVVDGCRSQTTVWWQSLSWSERARFLRTFQPYWDAHRHRVPDEVYAVIKQMQIEERLDVAASRGMHANPSGEGFLVQGMRSSGEEETIQAGWIINCTGPETSYPKAKNPLFTSAFEQGLIQYDPLGLGLMVDHRHATEPIGRVFAIGPLCRGCLWETIAIPEIRSQAKLIAEQCALESAL